MRLCKIQLPNGDVVVGALEDDQVRLIDVTSLSDILHAAKPAEVARKQTTTETIPAARARYRPPVDQQEIWAAGVTYKRSQEARERESEGAAKFYDLVYSAPRPELFFKATAARAVGPGDPVRVRKDSKWSVPEPELALVISPKMELVGFTIGNDMSARDIEGENPLYLPQAKLYDGSCALGPVIALAEAMPPIEQIDIRLRIERGGGVVFDGATSAGRIKRPFAELIDWLGRDNSFPQGAILLTGTGVVPPDDFALAAGDTVTIDITGVGQLRNAVVSCQ